MKKFIKKILIKFTALLVITSVGFLFIDINSVIAYEKVSTDKIFELVNKERIKNNTSPLKINSNLVRAANNKAKFLIDNNTFEHNTQNKKFSDWIKESGYNYSFIGENLAENFFDSKSAIVAWLESESHKENMLNKNFTETGIAIIQKNNRIIIVQIFGRPISKELSLEKTIKEHISENILKSNSKFKIKILSNFS
ncbi:MAG: CAP domain-containing protein [Patescibacteria group bacterium]|nr:CAP domain-containing protein [Patescibacteria group bacterium]